MNNTHPNDPIFTYGQSADSQPFPGPGESSILIPYLEYGAVAREADQDFSASKDAIVPTPHRGLSVVMKPFGCPSDTRTAQAWDVTFYYSLTVPNQTLVTVKVGLNSYIGNGGELSKLRDGTIIADGRLAVGHISDGTSNTILYGERPPSSDLLFGWHYVGWGVRARGMGELTSVIGVNDPNPFGDLHYDLNCGPGPFPYREPDLTAETDCAFFQYWSLHDGGANFAFADGSVRFLRYAANDILPALATRAGGEVVPAVD